MNAVSDKENSMCKICKRKLFIFKRWKEVSYGWIKGCETGKSSSKNWAVQGQIMKAFMVILRFLLDSKGHKKTLNSFNWKIVFTRKITLITTWKMCCGEANCRKWKQLTSSCCNLCKIRWYGWYGGVSDWLSSNMGGTIWTDWEIECKTTEDLVINYITKSWTKKNRSVMVTRFLDPLRTIRSTLQFSVTIDWFIAFFPEGRTLSLTEFGWLAWHP